MKSVVLIYLLSHDFKTYYIALFALCMITYWKYIPAREIEAPMSTKVQQNIFFCKFSQTVGI